MNTLKKFSNATESGIEKMLQNPEESAENDEYICDSVSRNESPPPKRNRKFRH